MIRKRKQMLMSIDRGLHRRYVWRAGPNQVSDDVRHCCCQGWILSLCVSCSLLFFSLIHHRSDPYYSLLIEREMQDDYRPSRSVHRSKPNDLYIKLERIRSSRAVSNFSKFSQVGIGTDVRQTMISSLLMFMKGMLMSRICLSLSLCRDDHFEIICCYTIDSRCST